MHLQQCWVVLALSLLIFHATLAPVHGQSYAPDCAVLEGMYSQSGLSPPWTIGSCCGYTTGKITIGCDGGGRIVEAHLASVNLGGSIPSLAGLANMQILDLTGNNFVGNLPNLNANPFLTQINVQRNNLAGNIDGLLPSTLSSCALTSSSSNNGLYSCTNNFPAVCQRTGDAAISIGGANCAAQPPSSPPPSTVAPPPQGTTGGGATTAPPPPALSTPPPPPPALTVVVISGVTMTTLSAIPPPPISTMEYINGSLVAVVTQAPPPPPPPVTTVIYVSGAAYTTYLPAPAPSASGDAMIDRTSSGGNTSSGPNIALIAGSIAGVIVVVGAVVGVLVHNRRRTRRGDILLLQYPAL
ncbi:hypothetical protein M427DRAFT_233500 [Gonapodya prolifera JEL478]|uniref:L domain-like protein n=1 Tax=Gonapodya prolifera (strain JEL478) TaxID=1344416 RepID=A0A138ZY07_GONPJ|nr:hypothetical protein M427DRAFT_233500 [Gonapodya prolifera JEL478]|eukprot:KXS09369.1 hypothetical protein M427DRAFT_233500 [Gonapodya prolifera JEL478]